MSRTDPIRPVVLVTRATGRCGGSVLRRIRERGRFDVRAMSRTPDSPSALHVTGIDVVAGDLDDVDALRNAMAGCYGVFGCVDRGGSGGSEGGTWERVSNLLDACADAGIGFVVLAYPAGDESEVARVEALARSVGVPVGFVSCEAGQEIDPGDVVAGAFEERVEGMLRA